MMAASFDLVARFDVIGCNSYFLKPGAARCFHGPHLRLALGILDFKIDPGMRYNFGK